MKNSYVEKQDNLGGFPRKGARFHHSFAKLYLYSYALRGLGNSPLPPQLTEAADCAISAALSILKMIISDIDVATALVGLPCYCQSMIGFACMFLAKFCAIHGDILIQTDTVVTLISQLKNVYSLTQVGQWHMVHLMPAGLDRILAMLQQASPIQPQPRDTSGSANMQTHGNLRHNHDAGLGDATMGYFDPLFPMEIGAGPGTSQYIYYEDPQHGSIDPFQSFN